MSNDSKEKKEHHLHDENFKVFFGQSVKYFMKLFYEDFYQSLDSEEEWTKVSEDVTSSYKFFTKDLGKYFVDRAFIVTSKDKQTSYVLHFEFQSSDDDMDERARNYNNLLSGMFKNHIVLTFVIGFNSFPPGKDSTCYSYSMKKYGLKSMKSFSYDLINLRNPNYSWNSAQFLNENEPNPMAIALWGLIEDNKSIKQNGVSMILKGYELLSTLQEKTNTPEEVIRPLKFLGDYIFPKLSPKQIKQLNVEIEKLKEHSKGEQLMSFLQVVQTLENGLKMKRETTLLLQDSIIEKLRNFGAEDANEIEEILNNVYDDDFIATAYKLLKEDNTGKTLREHLKKLH